MEKTVAYAGARIPLVQNDKIKICGRHTEADGCLAFDWTNSGVSFVFNGRGFILTLGALEHTDTEHQPAYIRVTVDGTKKQRFAVATGDEKIIIEGLPDKRHRVEILRLTEGIDPILFKDIALLGENAELRNPPLGVPRKIEFIGDSITCGYGVLGTTADPGFSTFQQDGAYSYAAQCAEMLSAEARYICVSGKGIVCNCLGDRSDVKGGEFYEYLTRKGGVCKDGWTPDVVVINLGTNDSGMPAPHEEFASAAKDLINKVRARYENAHIIWLYGLMSRYYADTLRETLREVSAKDEKVHFLFVDTMFGNPTETGANGHPNVRANYRTAEKLFKKIRSVTGWRNAVKIPEE